MRSHQEREITALRAQVEQLTAERDHLLDREKHNPLCSAGGWPCPLDCQEWASVLDLNVTVNRLNERVGTLTAALRGLEDARARIYEPISHEERKVATANFERAWTVARAALAEQEGTDR